MPKKKKGIIRRLLKWTVLVVLLAIIAATSFIGYNLSKFGKISTFFIQPNQTHLVVFQNDAELRPTGGFITAYAVIETQWGKPEITIKDSYYLTKHQAKEAPEALAELLENPKYDGHYFRDANTNPDWENSAKELQDFFNLNFRKEREFDSIISLNFQAIQNLIESIGPISVNGQIFNDDNLFYQLELATRPKDAHNEKSIEERKDVLNEFSKELMTQALQPQNLNKTTNSLKESLNSKNIQLYFNDQNLQKYAEDQKWDGKLKNSSKNDFLHINIANYGGSKSDRYINREVHYEVNIDEHGRATSNLTIEIDHLEGETLLTGDWHGWIRIYIPKNSKIINSDNYSKIYEEDDFTVIDQIVHIPTKKSKTIKIKYQLPQEFEKAYSIDLIKQSGTNDFYNLIINTPYQYLIQSNSMDTRENHAEFKAVLTKDQNLSLTFQKDNINPFITDQIFEGKESIKVFFSEKIKINKKDLENYKIEDNNFTFSRTDDPEIKSVKLDENAIILEVDGITTQPKERYSLEISEVQDDYGNVMPTETVTVVQN